MNIIIDQGNTSVKVAVFDQKNLVYTYHYKAIGEEELADVLQRYAPGRGILCCVGDFPASLLHRLKRQLNSFIVLDDETPLPIRIQYDTPHTLGKDRIAAAVGAYAAQPGRNLLVIDAGTAVTYDFVSAEGLFEGGNISPGMTTRFRSLHDYTSHLPLLNEEGDVPPLGYSTETAIRAGVVQGMIRELDSYVEEYQKKHNVLAFLTGGHSFYFADKLKSHIFADGNLVLKGLNEILMYQYA